ncbi:carotenoid 1,2-hydratase [Variovorax rhizosphaerae]|uniref:Carotenoid 1,2-hydratase n=1 Tax=Variovorax rhizosphaerae TaxID=1836200 RepID=A0ABU8WXJ4_9BURK
MTLGLSRRTLLLAALMPLPAWALPPRALQFPRDFGSHPDLRTEWWYITGQATAGTRVFGYQVTFFRTRIEETQSMQSAFAAKQLIFAHAAMTDLAGGKLLHDQRIARAGMGVAEASETDTRVHLRDWLLERKADGYSARIPASGFALDLRFAPTQPVLPQGNAGLSRKGPEQASYYYSEPQLAASGRITLQGQPFEVRGTAWLDHEWSQVYLHPDAAGWDWIGMNLADGSALMAFRTRLKSGGVLWAGGSFRTAGGTPKPFAPGEVTFEPLRIWKSASSQTSYPVEWKVRTPAGNFIVKALLDNQELDSRGSTGAIYWEGLSDLLDEQGRPVGRGYLEMTGYAAALRL